MVMREQGEWRDGFRFAGGHPALDLCATLRGSLKAAPVDTLERPEDLGRWLSVSGLSANHPQPTHKDLEAARGLREAIYVLAVARHANAPYPADALARLNDAAAGPSAAVLLHPDGSSRLTGSVATLLGHLARQAVFLLAGGYGGAIRQCEGETCAVLFHDQSRASARRWCSMSACGNRAKAAAFRRRDQRA